MHYKAIMNTVALRAHQLKLFFFYNINYNQVKLWVSMYIISKNVNCHTGGSNFIWHFDYSVPINCFTCFIIGSLLEVLPPYMYILFHSCNIEFFRMGSQVKFEPTSYLWQDKSVIYLDLFQKVFFQFIKNFSITSRHTVINSNEIKVWFEDYLCVWRYWYLWTRYFFAFSSFYILFIFFILLDFQVRTIWKHYILCKFTR